MIRFFRLVIPASILTLFISEAALLGLSYTLAAFFYPDLYGQFFVLGEQGWQAIAIMAAFILALMYLTKMYADLRIASRIRLMQSLAFVMGAALLAQALLTYLKLDWALPQRIVILGSALAFVLLFGWRMLFSEAIRNKL